MSADPGFDPTRTVRTANDQGALAGCESPDPTMRLAQARQAMLDAISPVEGWETVPIRAALGRVLMFDVTAPFDVPAHDNSAMDGYAVRSEDMVADDNRLTVVGTAFAGNAFSGSVGPGQAVRVMTGAVMPRGADSIVVQEAARVDGNTVILPKLRRAGQHVRRAGEDLRAGKAALRAGKKVGPAELGLMASLGFAEVTVRRRPRIAFFSTGDELASIGKTLAPGEVYDSNRYTLYGLLTMMGVDVVDMGVVRDEPEAMEKAFAEAAAQADAILTTGGVSVGEADFVKAIMGKLGEVKFWKIDIKPGRPLAFGKLGKAWLFGLPGNPVAVMVSFHQIVQDALVKLQGVEPVTMRPSFPVVAAEPIGKITGRREFPRGVLFEDDGQWKVKLSGNQGSGVLRSMVEANCFIVIGEDDPSAQAGDTVYVQPFAGVI